MLLPYICDNGGTSLHAGIARAITRRGAASSAEADSAPVARPVVVGIHRADRDAGLLVFGVDDQTVSEVNPDVGDAGAVGVLEEDEIARLPGAIIDPRA